MMTSDTLAKYFHGRYMERLERELDLNWKRLNIGLIALIASIAGYGAVIKEQVHVSQGNGDQFLLFAARTCSFEVSVLYTLAGLAVIFLVVYMLILVNQGRHWYRVNEAKVSWFENIMLFPESVGSKIDSPSVSSIYQIGIGTSGKVSVNRGIKIPLYSTGAVFSVLSALNLLNVLLTLGSFSADYPLAPTAFLLSILIFIGIITMDWMSRGTIDLTDFNKLRPVDNCTQRDVSSLIRQLDFQMNEHGESRVDQRDGD